MVDFNICPSSFQELHALPLILEEEEDVMCAIGRVLSSLTSVADLNAALEHLLKPSHVAIETLVCSDSKGCNTLHVYSSSSFASVTTE